MSGRFLMTKLFLLVLVVQYSTAWNSDEMEIFDAVEEIGKNFYEALGVTQEAELSEIKKAYRNLSKQLHPDKNDAPDAEIQFRQLVSMYDVLRDEGKRTIYNRVLVEGLPDWRSPIFYFRRARKMSMFEISIILTFVISLAQYLMAWGSYLDQRHTLEEALMKKMKVTKEKKRKKNEETDTFTIIEDALNKIPRPSLWNILPIQLVKFVIFLFTGGPKMVKETIQIFKEIKQEKEDEKLRQEEEARIIKEMNERKKEQKAQKKERKRVPLLPDRTGEETASDTIKETTKNGHGPKSVVPEVPLITGGPWTDEEFSELARLMVKYPGGTVGRWEIIAEQLQRTVYEVTKMQSKVKALPIRPPTDEQPFPIEPVEVKVKVKTKGTKDGEKIDLSLGTDDKWCPAVQKALEKALKLYPKGSDQRWDKIANCVPDKTKEECIIRFKYLAEMIRKKKEDNSTQENEDNKTELQNSEETNVNNELCSNDR